MAGGHKITVTVVVSGARVGVTVNPNQEVKHLVKKALDEAKIPHPKPKEWTLRFADGGGAIDPGLSIGEAGIADGATLFLDPDEGGGGEVAVALAGPGEEMPPEPPVLVDPAISSAKLDRQLADWENNAELYRERGWILLGRDGLHVDVAFTARLPAGPVPDLPAIPLAIRFCFENFDIWAPSVRVIDPITGKWLYVPRVRAIDFGTVLEGGAPLDLFVNGHPETGRVFLCKPGTREYHSHFEHDGDDWLLYRDQGFGSLGRLCDLLWRRAVRTVSGLNFSAQLIPIGGGAAQIGIEIRQEDPEALVAAAQAQLQAPQQIPVGQLPPELQAAFAQNQ
ncbi:MAG TPA: putative metal-binding protein [Solirubrobacterales bacterium]